MEYSCFLLLSLDFIPVRVVLDYTEEQLDCLKSACELNLNLGLNHDI